jgi:hypothetical protein
MFLAEEGTHKAAVTTAVTVIAAGPYNRIRCNTGASMCMHAAACDRLYAVHNHHA